MEAGDPPPGAEFQLTPALDRLRQDRGMIGLVVDGHCYDIGLPRAYLHTLRSFGGQESPRQ
jgi:UTP-glucose-1-phosphate uridylyltransferase